MTKILIVDSDKSTQIMTRIAIESVAPGTKVVFVSSNIQAEMYLQNDPYLDLVCADMDMPFMNGRDFISVLRKNGIMAQVVLLSNFDEKDEKSAEYTKIGVSILKKPITVDKMTAIVKKFLVAARIAA